MHTALRQGVEVDRQGGHQGFTLTGFHLGDLAFMQHQAADQLHIEMAHPQHPLGGLAHRGKGFRQHLLQRLTLLQPLPELNRLGLQLVIGKRFEALFQRVDLLDDFPQALQLALVFTSQNLFKQ